MIFTYTLENLYLIYCSSHCTQINLIDFAMFSSLRGNIQTMSKKFWYEFFLNSAELYLEFTALQKM